MKHRDSNLEHHLMIDAWKATFWQNYQSLLGKARCEGIGDAELQYRIKLNMVKLPQRHEELEEELTEKANFTGNDAQKSTSK